MVEIDKFYGMIFFALFWFGLVVFKNFLHLFIQELHVHNTLVENRVGI